jgi:hypothetical protein
MVIAVGHAAPASAQWLSAEAEQATATAGAIDGTRLGSSAAAE